MSNGLLGKALSSSTQSVTPYVVNNTANFATVTASLVNTGPEDAKVTLAITVAQEPGVEDYIEFEAIIPASGGTLERTCMLMSPNERLIMICDKDTVVIRVTGLEDIPTGV